MTDSPTTLLSPAGLARRDAMLGDLVGAMSRVHRARRARRRALAAGAVVIPAALLLWLAPGTVHRSDTRLADLPPTAPPVVGQPRQPAPTAVVIRRVQTDRSVLDRCRVEPTAGIVRLDDRMLLDTLASIGRPAGLVRFRGHTRLSTAVTDVALGLRR